MCSVEDGSNGIGISSNVVVVVDVEVGLILIWFEWIKLMWDVVFCVNWCVVILFIFVDLELFSLVFFVIVWMYGYKGIGFELWLRDFYLVLDCVYVRFWLFIRVVVNGYNLLWCLWWCCFFKFRVCFVGWVLLFYCFNLVLLLRLKYCSVYW